MISNGQSFNGSSERRNTEAWYWRMLGRIQPGAVS